MSRSHSSIKLQTADSKPNGARFPRRQSRVDPNILLIILFSLFTIGPLLQPGYMWNAHDARHSVYFLFEFDRGIQDGILYPRWQPDFAFGYGYPFFNIYGPLSTYAGEAFLLLGFGFAEAVKIVFALSVVASGLAMYGFVKQVLGRRAGLVAAVAYMVIPYRLVDLYVRAALAESVAYVFVPLVLWGVWAALHRPRLANVLGLAFAYAALLVTHPLTALLLTLILVFYVAMLALARVNDEQPFRQLSRESLLPLLAHAGHILLPAAFGLVLGLGLSAFSLLPAMTENVFVRLDQWYGGRYAWGGDFIEFFQLFSPKWGFGASVPGPDDDVSFQLGVVPVVLSLLALAPLFVRQASAHLGRAALRLIAFFAVLNAVVVFLMLGVSAILWQVLPLVRLAQFPWRLLSLTVVAMSFLCGAAAHGVRSEPGTNLPDRRLPGPATLVLVTLLVLGSLPYMRVEMLERPVSLAGLMQFQQSADEMTGSTAWARQIPGWSSMADYHLAGEPLTSRIDYSTLYRQLGRARARTVELSTASELVEYSAERPILITFNIFYYPGWHAYLVELETGAVIDELPIALRGELGLMTVKVPAGVGRVLIRFEDTPVRKLGMMVSLGCLALAGILLLGPFALRIRRGRRG
ncbi:hypothetical protein ACFLYD_06525 [Chloroflexota bacterium]